MNSDIGGGYLPVTKEDLFLTRPALAQLQPLDKLPYQTPLLRTNEISAETGYDGRFPPDRYGRMQKRIFAALTMRNRSVRNDWPSVVLRVLLDAAQEVGVMFNPTLSKNKELSIPDEITPCQRTAQRVGAAILLTGKYTI